MKKIADLLYEVTEDERVYDPDCELIESGILDSLALILLIDRLEDEGIELIITRIDRNMLKTPATLAKLIESLKGASHGQKTVL
ncbi:MAG: hypothetical protein IKD69_02670 [Solobacterium sp.]|nr:hypothetical protein [Solobacterium sp.]